MTEGPCLAPAPMVSVLCLTFNHAAFIAKAMESFCAQVTDFDVEVVVGDDSSTDHTLELVEGFREHFGNRLRVLHSPVNLGVTRNFRRTYQACRGRYVAICEGDDFWRGRRKLQTQVDFLEAHTDYVMCFHDATIVDSSGETVESQLPASLRCDASSDELIATRPVSTLTVCFRRVLDDLPAELDHAPALDLCLWSLLGRHGHAKYVEGIEPAGYRVHGAGVFSMQSDQNRHVMTAQSLFCLARVYARQGLAADSERVLLKALRMGSMPLGSSSRLQLLASIVVRLPVPLWRAARLWLERVRRPRH